MNARPDDQSAQIMRAATHVRPFRVILSKSIQVGLCFLIACSTPAFAAQYHGDSVGHQSGLEPLAMGSLVRLTFGLLAVLAAIIVAAWLMKRVGRFQSGVGGAMKVIGGLSMSARERVVLIQVGETQLLLGVAPGRVQTLHVLQERIASQSPDVESGRFAEKLRAALAKGGPHDS